MCDRDGRDFVVGVGDNIYEIGVCGSGGGGDLLLTGHDHDLQGQAPDEACGNTTFIVSGAGAKTRPLANHDHRSYFEQGDTLGVMGVKIAGDRLTRRSYDDGATMIFEDTMYRAGAVAPADHVPMTAE